MQIENLESFDLFGVMPSINVILSGAKYLYDILRDPSPNGSG
jgi:hypothetical protein